MVILPGGGNNKDDGGVTNPPTPTAKSPSSNKTGTTTTTRPRPPESWNVRDCQQWVERHCGDVGVQYTELFLKNNVNGRSLLRMNSAALERMGILNPVHRQEIWREIIKLKLKSDIVELQDLKSQVASYK